MKTLTHGTLAHGWWIISGTDRDNSVVLWNSSVFDIMVPTSLLKFNSTAMPLALYHSMAELPTHRVEISIWPDL